MANVPPELFRRKMAFRALEQLEEKANDFEAWAGNDNHLAAMASYNDLAARFAYLAGRLDIAQMFQRTRDALVVKGETPPTGPGAPKGKPQNRPKGPRPKP